MWWWFRWRARSRINTQVGLWYHEEYAASELPPERRIAHMQTDRAEQALGRLVRLGLLTPADVSTPPRARLEDLERVHPRGYLEQVTDPEVLGRIFGLAADEVEVDALLAAQRRAVGGTVAAALAVARGAVKVGFNLGGGFHHAAPSRGAGFCIYNDVAVAIARLRSRGFDAPIAIVDLDFHQGDGNLAAFADDPSVLVYSVHGSEWTSVESPACRNYTLAPGAGDREYLGLIDDTMRPAMMSHGTKLVFYVAGADVLAGDQLGDFRLSPRGVLARDRRVINAALQLGAPVVVTMAGGYSPGAWQCTANLVRWLLTGVVEVDHSPQDKVKHRFEEVARQIDPWDLQRDDDFTITEDDLMPHREKRPRRLVLDFYSAQGLELAFERYGLFDKIRQRGFIDLRIAVNSDDPEAQVVRVEGTPQAAPGPVLCLLELVCSRRTVTPPAQLGGAPLSMLRVEWLLLQNPTKAFSLTRPRLPGQEYPGLGLSLEVHQLLVQMSKRLRLEGLLHRPAHYHNAVVAGRDYHYLDPDAEGCFRVLRRLLNSVTLAEATHLVENGRVVTAQGNPFIWEPSELVMPATERLASYLTSEGYLDQAARSTQRWIDAGLHVVAAPEEGSAVGGVTQ